MNLSPIFLTPIFKERIWGGTALKERFGYDIPYDKTGECWAISAHPNGQNRVTSGAYAGITLGGLWNSSRELFGNHPCETFPLLTKILDANDDLSVQVHPDDTYAQKYENGGLGKTECWYILDCDEDAEIIIGHHAECKEQLSEWVHSGKWEQLLRKVKIKPDDFFYVPSGTIHALTKGTLVLETQQSSDVTYRLYDYDRIDSSGNRRELHIKKALDVIQVPHRVLENTSRTVQNGDLWITTYIQGNFFNVEKWKVCGTAHFQHDQHFLIVSVIVGEGCLTVADVEYPIKKGMHFILPFGFGEFSIEGNLTCIVSHP